MAMFLLFQNRFSDFFSEYDGSNEPEQIMDWIKQQFLATNQVKTLVSGHQSG